MDNDAKWRLTSLWESGRKSFASFFKILDSIRLELGDVKFEEWCRKDLMIGLTAITKAARAIEESDAARVAVELDPALQLEKQNKEKVKHDKLRVSRNFELAELEHQETVARKKLEIAKMEDELKILQSNTPVKRKSKKNTTLEVVKSA